MNVLFDTDAGPWTDDDSRRAFGGLGIGPGATVMVHSRLFTVGRMRDDAADRLLQTLLDVLGPEGTLIAPTFTLSFCKTGVFDVAASKSEVGMLSERIRAHADAKRTHNPVHSVSVIGKGQARYAQASAASSFGPSSIFDLLHGTPNVIFLTIGVDNPCDAITHVHYIEHAAAVPYRVIKSFHGVVRTAEGEQRQTIDCFVREPIDNVTFNGATCFAVTRDAGIFREARFGNSVAYAVTEKDYYAVLKARIDRDPHTLATYRRSPLAAS
jgi:aminoglycoside 3-N-acetyltransferase